MAQRTSITDVLPALDTMVDNIVAVFEQATPIELEQGRDWYAYAHLFAAHIDRKSTRRGAAVIAALSPQTSWPENVKLAQRAYTYSGPSGHTPANIKKVRDILKGHDPDEVLGGNKVRAFWSTIVDPAHPTAVVVDRHALVLAIGADYTTTLDGHYKVDGAVKILDRKGAYAYVADAYRVAAERLGVTPSQCQATTWIIWRRLIRSAESSLTSFETVPAPVVDDAWVDADRTANPNDYF